MEKPTTRFGVILLALVVLAAAGGYGVYKALQEQPASTSGAAANAAGGLPAGVPDTRPAFALPDLKGNERHISEWDGKVLLVNFWATWCPPCRSEIPNFMQLRDRYKDQGFEVIGVALDARQKVQDFADELFIDYPILMGEHRGETIAKQYGNRFGALPYSVIVNREGRIVFVKRGELKKPEAERALTRLLE